MRNSSQWETIKRLFSKAIDLPTEERKKLLQEINASDPLLCEELTSLLHAHESVSEEDTKPFFHFGRDKAEDNVFGQFPKGYRLADFEIIRPIGQGAFASVYLAKQLSLPRKVALKISHSHGSEAQTMAPLIHRNIVTVYSQDTVSSSSVHLIAMLYVPGTTLEKALKLQSKTPHQHLLKSIESLAPPQTRFNVDEFEMRKRFSELDYIDCSLYIGAQIADALAFAHSQNIFHLDVKPANILLSSSGKPYLSDFNVSIQGHGNGTEKLIGGTLNYMAPEHYELLNSSDSDKETLLRPQSDIFSLGLILAEMIALMPDSLSKNRQAGILNASEHSKLIDKTREQLEDSESSDTEFEPLNLELIHLLESTLDSDPKRRLQSAKELASHLRSHLELRQILSSMPPVSKSAKTLLKHPIFLLIGLALIPQLIGSLVNISYNSFQIVSALNSTQQELFPNLVTIYNAVVYPIGLLIVLIWLRPFFQWKQNPKSLPLETLLLRLRSWRRLLFSVITLGWLPGILFFPLGLSFSGNPVETKIYFHFFISISLSWLIALSFSMLSIQLLLYRVIYPRLCMGMTHIREKLASEIKVGTFARKFFPLFTGIVPLIGALLVIQLEPHQLLPEQHRQFHLLTSLLITLGLVGVYFSVQFTSQLSQTLFALLGNTSHQASS